ncbi:MAG: hypothetical protein M3154_03620 [Candidatus Eremiobacteraeota bacterium]|nr:hypothetical protein [Candidatus Eremiobacteraeota bacterium]
MRSFRTFLYAFAVVALAACGGGSGGGALPPASDPGTRDPSGSSVAFENTTLWVGYQQQVNAFSTKGNGPVTPAKTLPSFRWSNSIAAPVPGIVDVAIAPDGTQWLLENRSAAEGGPGWRLFAVAPGDNQPENTYGDDVTFPFALGLAGDGVMVGYRDSNGVTTIATYPYAANNAPPLRTFRSTGRVLGFAEGNDGHLYVARPNGVDVYDPTSNGCCAIRSIATTGLVGHVTISSQEFAVGPNNSIYVTDLPGSNSNPVMYVNVYPPGSGKVGRRIGPLPANYDGLGFPVIAVDSSNRLYVATNGQIYRFGPSANGAAKPQRLMTDSTQSRPTALAVGPKL